MKALLLDLDGTVLDTLPDLTQAINVVLAKHNRPPITEESLRPTVSFGATGMLCHAFQIDRQHPSLNALRETCLEAYADCMTEKTRFFPGMQNLLDELDTRRIPWGIVTNKSHALSEPLMAHFKLLGRSQCLVAGDTLPTRKPDPGTLLHAAELIQLPATAFAYVGDAKTDIQAARAAKMFSIAARYGYLPNTPPVETWKADKIIDSPAALQAFLKQLVI